MIAMTWAEFWTEVWNTEVFSWKSLAGAGVIVVIGLFFNALR